MQEEMIQEVMENNDIAEETKEAVYQTFPVEDLSEEGTLKEKLIKGGIFAAGAAAGALTTKVIIPGVKKGVGWVKGKFTKKKKDDPEKPDKEESAEEEKEDSKEESAEEKKPDKKHKKGRK